MQLICRIETKDQAAWRRDFDAEAEKRMNAGMTLLQLWHEADRPETVLALFEVNDRARARAYLETESRLGASLGDCTFLRTA